MRTSYQSEQSLSVADFLGESADYASVPGISCVTPGNPYRLHCFPAFEADLLDIHRAHLERILEEIERSFRTPRPIRQVKR